MPWRRLRRHQTTRRPCAPSDGDPPPAPGTGVGASTGSRTTPRLPLSGPRVTTSALHAGGDARRTGQRVQDHRAARGSTTAAEGLA